MRNEHLTTRVDPVVALKAQLGDRLAGLLQDGNADDLAWVIGTDRPRVSELRRGKLTRFSLGTLIRYLGRLNHRVDITVTRVRPRYGRQSESPSGVSGAPGTEPRIND